MQYDYVARSPGQRAPTPPQPTARHCYSISPAYAWSLAPRTLNLSERFIPINLLIHEHMQTHSQMPIPAFIGFCIWSLIRLIQTPLARNLQSSSHSNRFDLFVFHGGIGATMKVSCLPFGRIAYSGFYGSIS
ncbi:unnamed protein product [Protopolystoma xenopodis]|uniref:Uncharacterized protein n=1 Tax=Protopolystoma xenopodis TaxID=117903 RepID=A0A3S5C4T8_9PLAT|nr:unnamed protein product [Protopolystoma xenopodis]